MALGCTVAGPEPYWDWDNPIAGGEALTSVVHQLQLDGDREAPRKEAVSYTHLTLPTNREV